MAEREGFEPPDGLTRQRFSRPPLSTTQPPLRTKPFLVKNLYQLIPSAATRRLTPRFLHRARSRASARIYDSFAIFNDQESKKRPCLDLELISVLS